MSDSHDQLEPLQAAIQILRDAGAEFYFHCGDVGSEQILDALAGLPCALVWGNTDWDRVTLTRYGHDLHLQMMGAYGEMMLAGKQIAVTHGDEQMYIRQTIQRETFDYLFTGHTHLPHDQRLGKLRWINPGALHRAKPRMCASLNLATDELTRYEVLAG